MVRRVAKSVVGKASVYVVDVDEHPDIAQQYGVRGIPTLQVFKDGEMVETIRSADENTLRERLLAHVD